MSRFALLDTRNVAVPPRSAAPAGATPSPTPAKADATAKFVDGGFNLAVEPIVVTAALDPFDPAAANPLSELGVICLPAGTPVPNDLSTVVGSPAYPQAGVDVSSIAPGTLVPLSIGNTNPGPAAAPVTLLLIGIYAD